MPSKPCPHCGKPIKGRSDKVYCSLLCKNQYSYLQKQKTKEITKEIDAYLHRNREILETLMGQSKKETIDKLVIVRTGFKFEYMTGIYFNKENKIYHLIYDFAWMDFSDQKILIIKKSK